MLWLNCILWVIVSVLQLHVLQAKTANDPNDNQMVAGRNKVLLVSMDGFRYDYFSKASTPNFDAIMKTGVAVPFINSTFPTLSISAHYTISTGLYAESHGIVMNTFADPALNRTFSYGNKEAEWWDSAEPVWTNAVKAGLKVGTFNWVGANAKHDGLLPTAFHEYDENVPYDVRARTLVDWLAHEDFDLGMVYFEEPDHAGHLHGPDGPQTVSAIQRMDDVMGTFLHNLDTTGLKVIMLDRYVNSTLLAVALPVFGAAAHLIPQPGKARALVGALSGIKHLHVYLKEDVPERFHYRNNPRIAPVIAYCDEGWLIALNDKKLKIASYVATHGFDSDLMSMKGIFVATGPSFKTGYRLPVPISILDVYPLVCHLLGLTPAPNNGSLERVMPLLLLPPL